VLAVGVPVDFVLVYRSPVTTPFQYPTDWLSLILEAKDEQDLDALVMEVFEDGLTPFVDALFPDIQQPLLDVLRDGGIPSKTCRTLITHIKFHILNVAVIRIGRDHSLASMMLRRLGEWLPTVTQEIDWGPPDFREKREAWLKESLKNARL
jgi:hypothetical protein